MGLGNPGRRYEGTRHNLGFKVVESLAQVLRISFSRPLRKVAFGEGEYKGRELFLAKPLTYMNLSGTILPHLFHHISKAHGNVIHPEELLVVCDDVALPPGRIRLRRKGSSGGHKGLASVIDSLGTQDFPRLRIGIGGAQAAGEEMPGSEESPYDDLAEYVLQPFLPEEEAAASQAVEAAVQAVLTAVEWGIEKTMNQVNRPQDETC